MSLHLGIALHPAVGALTVGIVLLGSVSVRAGARERSVWREVAAGSVREAPVDEPLPEVFRAFELAEPSLESKFRSAAHEDAAVGTPTIVTLPMPDGTLARFSVLESSLLAPSVAREHPYIKTFRLQGIDDPAASGRASWTHLGFHASISTDAGSITIRRAGASYLSYHERELARSSIACGVATESRPSSGTVELRRRASGETARPAGTAAPFKKYDYAIATTQGFCAAAGGASNVASKITQVMDKVEEVVERDASVRLNIVGILAYCTNPNPFSNYVDNNACADSGQLFGVLQTTFDNAVAAQTIPPYDVGHLFSHVNGSNGGVGGCAGGRVCETGYKGKAQSRFNAVVDGWIVVLHEIGHQLGAGHTWSGTTCNPAAEHNPAEGVEPGSGSTIMSYAGLCSGQNITAYEELYYHARSLSAISAWNQSGGSCYDSVTNSNDQPEITLQVPPPPGPHQSLKVPRETPFKLSATGSDPGLEWTWEPMNASPDPTDPYDGSDNPLFRSYFPSSTASTRTFPKYSNVLANNFTALGEVLPTVDDLPMTFVVTARDGRGATDAATVDLVTLGDPFVINEPAPGGELLAGENTITWDHEGAEDAGADEVEAFFSENNGSTWDSIGVVPNTGEAVLEIEPSEATQTARVKLEAVDNVFFTVSQPFWVANIECPATYGCPANCIPANCHAVNLNEPACFENGEIQTCHWGSSVVRTICDCVQPPTQGGRGGGNQIPVPVCPSGHTNQSWTWSPSCN